MVDYCQTTFNQIDPFGDYGTKPVSCCRQTEDQYAKCLWHRDTYRKPVTDLITSRTDYSESLQQAILRGCHIDSKISFRNCDLSEAVFCGSSLSNTDLQGVHAIHTDFSGCDLTGADFRGARLFANFAGSDLTGANLQGADVTHCNFAGANLSEIHLDGTEVEGYFQGANFSETLSPDQICRINKNDLLRW